MANWILEVRVKTSNEPMLEAYYDESSAKSALQSLTRDVQNMKQIVVSSGGGIAFSSAEFAGASVRPRQP